MDIDFYLQLRQLADEHQSKINMDFRKQRKITKFEDLSYIIYVNQRDIFQNIHMDAVAGELNDLCFRGGGVESVVYSDSGEFPPECSSIELGDVKLGVLWLINTDSKCPRCWKRHAKINETTGLCPRCQTVIEEYYPEFLLETKDG